MQQKIEISQPTKNDIRFLEKNDLSFMAHFDIIMVRILQKFYGKNVDPLSGDVNSYDVNRLRRLLEKEGLKITTEGLRKKLNLLVKLGFIEKVRTYPRIYMSVRDFEKIKQIQRKIQKIKQILL